MDEREFRVLAKHCFFIGKTADEAQQWLERCYTDIENATIPENETICRWYEEFEQADNAESKISDAAERGKDSASAQSHERQPASFDQSCLCDTCGKEFTRADTLKKHRRIHTNDSAYQCESCGKQFRDKKNLQSHENIHSGAKPFACNLCEYRSACQSNVNKHFKLKHRKQTT